MLSYLKMYLDAMVLPWRLWSLTCVGTCVDLCGWDFTISNGPLQCKHHCVGGAIILQLNPSRADRESRMGNSPNLRLWKTASWFSSKTLLDTSLIFKCSPINWTRLSFSGSGKVIGIPLKNELYSIMTSSSLDALRTLLKSASFASLGTSSVTSTSTSGSTWSLRFRRFKVDALILRSDSDWGQNSTQCWQNLCKTFTFPFTFYQLAAS